MIDKTRLGLSCFDERYGGLYRKRAALCVGRKGSGKTLLGVQALLQSVKEGERGLMLSAWRAHDLTITTNRLGLPLADAIDKGQVILLECANLILSLIHISTAQGRLLRGGRLDPVVEGLLT